MNRKEFFRWGTALLGGMAWHASGRPASLSALQTAAAAEADDVFWDLVRDQFLLDPGWTYLNFGGLGACPFPVLNNLIEWTREEERAPSAGRNEEEWTKTKEKLAALLGKKCRKEEIALISCATEGINQIINGLPLKKGDEVITSTHEHVAVNSGLLNRMQRDGIIIRIFDPDLKNGLGNVDRINRLISKRTRLILISHVSCTTGQIFPAREISDLARSKGIWFALDGAQAPVCIPFDIVESGADFYTASTHKWVMAPKRTGFFYVRDGLLNAMRPLTVGGFSTEANDIAKGTMTLHPTTQRYEYGTQNDALFYALGKAVEFVQIIGMERIWSHNHSLAERFYRGLGEIPGVERLSPEEEKYRSAIIGFRMDKHDFKKINEFLTGKRIRVRTVNEGGLNSIRVSFHICNRMTEVDQILDALKSLS